MDSTAFALCRDNRLPIVVFDLNQAGNVRSVVTDGRWDRDQEGKSTRFARCDVVDDILQECDAGMKRAMERSIATRPRAHGRANLALLDGVRVDYYGTPTRSTVASLNVADARLITIKPWEKNMIRSSTRRSGRATSASTGRRLGAGRCPSRRHAGAAQGAGQADQEDDRDARVAVRGARREQRALKEAEKTATARGCGQAGHQEDPD